MKADRFAQKLLKKAQRGQAAQELRDLSLKKSEVRDVYYHEILKTARGIVESAEGGPLTGAARLLLCGSQICQPARYLDPKSLDRVRQGEDGVADIGGEVSAPVKLRAPQPQYTTIARQARIQGVVVVQVIVDKQGTVTKGVVLKGLPLGLSESALAAIRQWKFKPALLNGEPVDVYYNWTVNFHLR